MYARERFRGSKGQSIEVPKTEESESLADSEKPKVEAPVNVPAIEVQVPLDVTPVEARHVATATDRARGAESDDRILPLLLAILRSESKQVFDLGRFPALDFDRSHRIFRRDKAAEMEESGFVPGFAIADDRESIVSNVTIGPVVPASSDHLSE